MPTTHLCTRKPKAYLVLTDFFLSPQDNGKLQLTSTATLTITVTDGDDQGPQFRHLACQKAFGGKCFTPTYNADVESVLEVSSFYS